MRSINLILLLLLASLSFSQRVPDRYEQLMLAYQKDDTALLQKFICRWQNDRPKVDQRKSDPAIKALYDLVESVLIDTSSSLRYAFGHDLNQYLIVPTQIDYLILDQIDPDSVIRKAIMSSKQADSIKIRSINELSRNPEYFQLCIESGIYSIDPDKYKGQEKTIKYFYPNSKDRFLLLDDSSLNVLQHFMNCKSRERNRRITFLQTKVHFPANKQWEWYRDHPSTDKRNSIPEQYTTEYIKEIILDKNLDWALVCYRYFSKRVVLYKRDINNWKFFQVVQMVQY